MPKPKIFSRIGTYVESTGSANTYAVTTSSVTSYYTGLRLGVQFNIANTGASTLNINSLGAKSIKKSSDAGLVAVALGDIILDGVYDLVYDGTDFIIMDTSSSGAVDSAESNVISLGGLIY